MFFNILRKDLKRKKTMNIILLIFIVLCTTFMATSVSNLLTTSNAIDYFGRKTNISDYFVLAYENEEIDNWIETSIAITDSQREVGIVTPDDSLLIQNGTYQTSGVTTISKLPEQYNLILNNQNEPLTSLISGEIAIPYLEAQNNDLSVGDTIAISLGDKEKTLTVTYITKDMVFGTSYMGFTRLMISDADFDFFYKSDEAITSNFYSIRSNDTEALKKDLNKQTFSVTYHFDKDTVGLTFTMEMMVAAILIIVSIFLIIIALVILRFTIGFTLQEDYKEIGIMKAIGLKNAGIKGLYIIKYFVLAVIGAAVGVVLSIPLGNMMIENVKNSVAMESAASNLPISILCGGIVVLLVTTFCYLSASKLNKFTAIQAIRNGSTGERYKSRGLYKLHRHRKAPAVLSMAINDILSNIKSYSVLVITFILGTLLVILPLNVANTLSGDDIVEWFGIAKSDVYIDNSRAEVYIAKGDVDYMLGDIKEMEQTYRDNGIDVSLYVEYMLSVKVYTDDQDEGNTIVSIPALQSDASNYNSYLEGTAPTLPNEIAMAERSMEKLGVGIGDSVNIITGDTTKSYIITASFQSMSNMGEGLRFASVAETNFKYVSNIVSIQGNFNEREDIQGQIARLKEITPSYNIYTTHEFISKMIGGVIDSINSIKFMILTIVLLINCLITVLLTRTFITRDMGEIALLKNIGFTNKAIKIWQVLRIIFVLFVSIIIGILLSNPLNAVTTNYSFGYMGAPEVSVNIVPLEVYLVYPLLLFLGTSVAAILSTGGIRKISLREINNIE